MKRQQASAREIDHYKEQIEVLMLHIDDPFILQEIQMKQSQQPQEKENRITYRKIK